MTVLGCSCKIKTVCVTLHIKHSTFSIVIVELVLYYNWRTWATNLLAKYVLNLVLMTDKLLENIHESSTTSTSFINETKHYSGKHGNNLQQRSSQVSPSMTPFICVKCDVNLNVKCF